MFNSVKQPQKQKQKLTTPGTPIATLENTRPAVFNPGVKFEPGTNGSEKKKKKSVNTELLHYYRHTGTVIVCRTDDLAVSI